MHPKKPLEAQYQVTRYDTREMNTWQVTRTEAKNIDPKSVDHFMAPDFGIWGFRTAQGHWIAHRTKWPMLGTVSFDIIIATQLNYGDFLPPADVVYLTGYQTLRNGNALSARWLTIRKAHNESYAEPHFFLTRRAGGFAIGWNPQRSWCWVERIPPLPEPVKDPSN